VLVACINLHFQQSEISLQQRNAAINAILQLFLLHYYGTRFVLGYYLLVTILILRQLHCRHLSLLLFLLPPSTLPALGSAHSTPPPMHAGSPLVTTASPTLLLADIVRGSGGWCPCATPWWQFKGWSMTAACWSLSAPSSPFTPCHSLPCSSTFLPFTFTSAGDRTSPKPRQ